MSADCRASAPTSSARSISPRQNSTMLSADLVCTSVLCPNCTWPFDRRNSRNRDCSAAVIPRGFGRYGCSLCRLFDLPRFARNSKGGNLGGWYMLPHLYDCPVLAIVLTQITNVSYNPRYSSISPLWSCWRLASLQFCVRAERPWRGDHICGPHCDCARQSVLESHLCARGTATRRTDAGTDFGPNDILIIGNVRMLAVLQFYGARFPDQMLHG